MTNKEKLENKVLNAMEKYGIYDIQSVFYFLEIDDEAKKEGLDNSKVLEDKSKHIRARRYISKLNQFFNKEDTRSVIEAFKMVAPDRDRSIIMGDNASDRDSNSYLQELQAKTILELTKKRDGDKEDGEPRVEK